MLSIQETLVKAETQLKAIREYMNSKGYYDHHDCTKLLFDGLKRSIQREVAETIRHLTVKEFLFKGTTTGYGSVQGSNYLLAPVLASKIYTAVSSRDIGPEVAADIINEPVGETIYVPTAFTRAYEAGEAGDKVPQGMKVERPSLTYTKYVCPLVLDSEMMEDSGYSLIDLAAKQAGQALAIKTNDQILSVLKRTASTTGIGTKQTAASGNSTTTPAHIATIAAQVASGGDTLYGVFHPDTAIFPPEVWYDAVGNTDGFPKPEIANGKLGILNTVIVNSQQLGTVASNRLDLCVIIVIEKALALIIARKSWLRIENYSNPLGDLSGAVVSVRQGCAELVDSAIGIATET